jgi:hypothetical protein
MYKYQNPKLNMKNGYKKMRTIYLNLVNLHCFYSQLQPYRAPKNSFCPSLRPPVRKTQQWLEGCSQNSYEP